MNASLLEGEWFKGVNGSVVMISSCLVSNIAHVYVRCLVLTLSNELMPSHPDVVVKMNLPKSHKQSSNHFYHLSLSWKYVFSMLV